MKNISLMTPINFLGYGQVGKNVVTELGKQANVSLFPIGNIDVEQGFEGIPIISKCLENCKQSFEFQVPAIKIWHQNDMAVFPGYDNLRIGFPIFELNKFTDLEKFHLNNVDRIFVCSDWAKKIVLDQTNHHAGTVHVVPLGVNDYGFRKQKQRQSSTTEFFTCGKWEIRKGHDVLIKAFCEAFGPQDDVMLNMVCHNPFLSDKQTQQWQDLYMNSDMGHRIRFVDRFPAHKQLIEFMSNMDCGVFISRAEGWNLELLETMSCGVPVIATNYSGHTEFCNKDNSLLVDIDDLELAHDGIWFHGQGEWGSLKQKQISQIANFMRYIHKEKPYNNNGIQTARKFSWENSATRILQNVE